MATKHKVFPTVREAEEYCFRLRKQGVHAWVETITPGDLSSKKVVVWDEEDIPDADDHAEKFSEKSPIDRPGIRRDRI